jgi:hypothetical protein
MPTKKPADDEAIQLSMLENGLDFKKPAYVNRSRQDIDLGWILVVVAHQCVLLRLRMN